MRIIIYISVIFLSACSSVNIENSPQNCARVKSVNINSETNKAKYWQADTLKFHGFKSETPNLMRRPDPDDGNEGFMINE